MDTGSGVLAMGWAGTRVVCGVASAIPVTQRLGLDLDWWRAVLTVTLRQGKKGPMELSWEDAGGLGRGGHAGLLLPVEAGRAVQSSVERRALRATQAGRELEIG